MLSLKKKKSLNFEWSDLAENNNTVLYSILQNFYIYTSFREVLG